MQGKSFSKKSGGILCKGNRLEAYRFIEQYYELFGLRRLLRRLNICPNAYYNYRKHRKADHYAHKAERSRKSITHIMALTDTGVWRSIWSVKVLQFHNNKFKSEFFLREVKEVYTNLINRHISDPEQQLKVFDKNSVYPPTKKIGKNNAKAAEIEADNTARQEWNRTADMPPKPTLAIDMAEFRHMWNLMIKVQDKAREIKTL